MSKQKPKKIQVQKKQNQQTAAASFPPAPALFPLSSFRQQSIFIVLIGFIIYFNSFSNKYALDDDIVMRLNDMCNRGFRVFRK